MEGSVTLDFDNVCNIQAQDCEGSSNHTHPPAAAATTIPEKFFAQHELDSFSI